MLRLCRFRLVLASAATAAAVGVGAGIFLKWREARVRQSTIAAQEDLNRFRYTSAAHHAERAVKYDLFNRGEVSFLAARCTRRAGDLDKARDYLKAAEKSLGDTKDVRLEKQLLAAQRGDAGDVVESLLWQRAHMEPENRRLILESLTQGLLATYRLHQVRRAMTAWFTEPNDDPRAYYWRAIGREAQGGHFEERAIEDYRRALQLDHEFDDARENLALLLLRKRDPEGALPLFETLISRRPESRDVQVGLARCLITAGDYERSRTLLGHVLAENPNDAEALREMGGLNLLEARLHEAELVLRRALEKAPFDHAAAYHLSVCLGRMRRDKESREYAERCHAIEARNDRMQKLMREEFPKRPKDADLLYEIGIFYLEQGNAREELTGLWWLQQALDVNPRHEASCRWLAGFYERRGRPDLAARLRRVSSNAPP